MSAPPIISLQNVSHEQSFGYPQKTQLVNINLSILPHEHTLLTGAPESGKSLLLHLIGLFFAPDSGEITVFSHPAHSLSEEKRTALRTRFMGVVFSAPHLLPDLSVAENIALPFLKTPEADLNAIKSQTESVLESMDLLALLGTPAEELTIELQYRIALARAIAHHPKLLLLEDPMPLLPASDYSPFLQLLFQLASQYHFTIISTSTVAPPFFHFKVIHLDNGTICPNPSSSSS